MLFIYTDGLNEAENQAQEQYGDDQLQQMMQQMKSGTAKQVIDAFRQSVESHRNGIAPNDDLTMLAIRCLG
jgi:serine phosphatase RsbU (regulator of sigma subunit)